MEMEELFFSPENGDVSSSAAGDLFVDQLLNLNSDNTEEDAEERQGNSPPEFAPAIQPLDTAGEGDFGSFLMLPEEEAADLEWLSRFVEDSFAGFSHVAGAGASSPETQKPPSRLSPPPLSSLPRSRRSKRPRPAFPAACRVWAHPAIPISSSLTESTTSSSPSSSATSSPHWPTSPSTPLAFPISNPKKKKPRAGPGPGPGPASGRKCSHCGTQKTPQWRAGPMGTKTLCNACGVRFKAGRLLPEYRPACSPTFSSGVHSNSHRKVLEMRMKKESTGLTEPGLVHADPNRG